MDEPLDMEQEGVGAPAWAAFGDLMAGVTPLIDYPGGGSIVDARGTVIATTIEGEAMVALADLPVEA